MLHNFCLEVPFFTTLSFCIILQFEETFISRYGQYRYVKYK